MAITWSKAPWMEKINLNGTEAYFADAEAREKIEQLSSPVTYCGVYSASKMVDGGTEPATVTPPGESQSRAVKAGDFLINKYGDNPSCEFMYDGTAWRELGSTGSLKGFAFVDKGSTCYTPSGSLDFVNAKIGTLELGALELEGSATGCYTPSGTITGGEVVAAGSVDVSTVKAKGTVTLDGVKPEGTVDLSAVKAAGSIDLSAVKAAGSVEAPEVTLACTTDTVTTHSFCFDASTHVLSITDNTTQTLVASVGVDCVTAPAFCGGVVTGTAAFCGAAVTGTAEFCGSALTGDAGFCGTGMEGTATFCGSCVAVGGLGFCGAEAALDLDVAGCTTTTSVANVSLASVSGAAFCGSEAKIEVTPEA